MKQCQLCPPMTDVGRCATIVSSTSSSELAFLIGPGAINIIHNIISDYYYYKILHHLWNQTFNSSCFISPLSSHVSHNFSVIILERVYGKNTKYDIHYTQSLLHNHIHLQLFIHRPAQTDDQSKLTTHSYCKQHDIYNKDPFLKKKAMDFVIDLDLQIPSENPFFHHNFALDGPSVHRSVHRSKQHFPQVAQLFAIRYFRVN